MGRLTRALPAPAALILFCALWRLPTVNDLPWLNDEGTYATVGRAIMSGEALYRQVWENKPPGIYLVFGAAHLLLGPAHLLLGVRVLALLAAIAAQIAIYRLARGGTGRSTALLAVGLSGIALDLPLLDGASANAEIFLAAATGAGMALLWRSIRDEGTINTEAQRCRGGTEEAGYGYTAVADRVARTTKRHPAAAGVTLPSDRSRRLQLQPEARPLLLAGVAFGMAILLKLPAGADLLAALAILLARPGPFQPATRLTLVLPLLAGVALPVGAVAIWLATRGLIGDALYATIGYNRGYVSTGQGDHPFILNVLGGLGLLAVLWLGFRLVRGRADTFFAGAMCWWFALALLGALASGRSYPHYYLQAVPPLAILLALLIRQLPIGDAQHRDTEARRDHGERRNRTALRALAVLLLVWVLGVPLVSWLALRQDHPSTPPGSNHLAYYGYIWERLTGDLTDVAYGNRIDPRVERNLALVRYLQAHPAIPRRLYIWGNTPWIYYLSGYAHAARFTSAFYRPPIPGGMDQTVAALRADLPPYIVVIAPPKPASSALAALLRTHYRSVARIEDAVIYSRG